MSVVKGFGFWPLLAIVCLVAVSAVSNPDHGSMAGSVVGLALSVPLALVIDGRRRHRQLRSRRPPGLAAHPGSRAG
jgi:hypothetical protein